MSQGLFAGATNYQEQTKEDIALDIEKWIRNAKEMKYTMGYIYCKTEGCQLLGLYPICI